MRWLRFCWTCCAPSCTRCRASGPSKPSFPSWPRPTVRRACRYGPAPCCASSASSWSSRARRPLPAHAAGGQPYFVAGHPGDACRAPLPLRLQGGRARLAFCAHAVHGAGTLYIERESRRDAHRVVTQMAERLQAGDILAVFPEGTTGDGITLKHFHANLIQAAIEASVPVQPVGVEVHRRGQRRHEPRPAMWTTKPWWARSGAR
jgi:1-acyl-sn-glycerol-3-phosphate acyltransferase